MSNNKAIITEGKIFWYSNKKKKLFEISKDDPKFLTIKKMIVNNESENNINEYIETKNIVKNVIKNKKGFYYKKDKFYFNGKLLDTPLVSKIQEFILQDVDVDYLIKFIKKLYKNPSKNSINNLFTFIEKNDITINENGNILFYKAITHDFKDMRTKTFNNQINSIVKMDRNKVCDDPTVACSSGLHVSTLSYAKGYAGDKCRIILAEVDPADVVSVPNDYSNQKVRVCKYKVLSEFVYDKELKKTCYNTKTNKEIKKENIKIKSKKGTRWEKWEDDYILKHYKNININKISQHINRSVNAIRKRYSKIK